MSRLLLVVGLIACSMGAHVPQRVPATATAYHADLTIPERDRVPVNSQSPTAPLPLEVSRIELSATEPAVMIELINKADKTVTAWNVRVAVQGNVIGKGTDAYRGFEGLTEASDHILPGHALAVTIRLSPGTTSTSVPVATVTAIIFDDKSFAGDASWVDSIFKRRAAELAGWSQVVTELETLSSASDLSRDAITAALSHLAATGANDEADAVRQNARANLALLIRDLSTQPAAVRPRLQFMLTLARNNKAAASAHAR